MVHSYSMIDGAVLELLTNQRAEHGLPVQQLYRTFSGNALPGAMQAGRIAKTMDE